jgi:putative exosortase-associated protein (TIGR04073 family)
VFVSWITCPTRVAAALALIAVLVPGTAAAVEYTAARKLGRGLGAITTGFLEIPGNIVDVGRDRGYGWGFTWGFALGLGKIVPRVLVGVYETISAPFPLPKGFVPIMEPEFPWTYFESGRNP